MRELLVIDQLPLLNDALDDCQRAYRHIESMRAQLHRYESKDLPAYER